MICPPFFHPSNGELGLTKNTKPLLSQVTAAKKPEPKPYNVIKLSWERNG